jgi:DNA topoisomerase-1
LDGPRPHALCASRTLQRITIAWCKAHEVPIQKQFPKTLLAKFAWAMSIEPEFRF